MKDIIEIEGQKYKKIKEDSPKDNIKGQGLATFVFIGSIIMAVVSVIIQEWDGVILSIFLVLLCGGIGFDALDDIRDRFNAQLKN